MMARAARRSERRAPWGWAGAGMVAGLLGGLLVYAPASWLAGGLDRLSSGRLQLQAGAGTLWSGSAQLMLTGGPGSPDRVSLPGRLEWRLRPTLHQGPGLELTLRADCCLSTPWVWQIRPGWGRLDVQLGPLDSRWPARWLTGLGTPWNTIGARGRLVVTSPSLGLSWAAGRWQMSGQAQLDALDISSHLSTLQPMGSYRLSLTGGASARLELSTLSGDLRLSGQGQWVGGRLRFSGEAASAAHAQAALSNLLNIIGRRSGARSIIQLG